MNEIEPVTKYVKVRQETQVWYRTGYNSLRLKKKEKKKSHLFCEAGEQVGVASNRQKTGFKFNIPC